MDPFIQGHAFIIYFYTLDNVTDMQYPNVVNQLLTYA